MSGFALIVVFALAIALLIISIAKWKVHPFLALMGISLIFAFIAGMPLQDVKEGGKVVVPGILNTITSGFSGTFRGIGLVIIFGAAIGALLEATGGALKIADCVVRWIGPKHPELATMIMGWIVSIPVFCDSGFVILNPIRRALVQKTKHSSVAMTVCLSAGLYTAHVFIPPTPGPIAAADALGVSGNLLLIMAMGALVSIPALIAAYFYALKVGKTMKAGDEAENSDVNVDELLAQNKDLPGAFLSFLPIILPIILMAANSIANATGAAGSAKAFWNFIGNPIIALTCGLLAGFVLYAKSKPEKDLYEIINNTLMTVGPILFITAAGGVLGKVIANSGMITYIKDHATALAVLGIVFPFLLSAILKTAQGSSTVALVTTASIMAPLMATMGLDSEILRVLTVLAIGAGAMTVSHANDSYFWVVTRFGNMTTEQGYRTQTLMTLIMGVVSIVFITLLWLIIG